MKILPLPTRLTALLLLSAFTASKASAQEATSLIDLVRTGGWAMWPLAAGSLLACHLVVASLLELRRSRFLPQTEPDTLRDRIEAEGLPAVAAAFRHDRSAASPVLFDTAAQACDSPGPLPPAERFSEAVSRLEIAHSGKIQLLNIIATVAPMIGLLGTVSGMIGAFQTISGGGMGKAELLAGDIGEALVTTAAGLIVGIPAMVAFYLLRSKLQANLAQLSALGEVILERAPNRTGA